MEQESSASSTINCPFCGAPVAMAEAKFCAVCGRELTSGAPNIASQAQVPAFGAAPPPPVSSYAGSPTPPSSTSQLYGAPWPGQASGMYPPQVVVMPSPKSRGTAILLEFLLAGAGALYLDRKNQGLMWLFGTLLVGVGGQMLLNTYAPDAIWASLLFDVAVLVWGIIRIAIVAKQAKETPKALPQPRMSASAARMAWLGLAVAVVTVSLALWMVAQEDVGLSSTSYPYVTIYAHEALTALSAAVGAYLLALRRQSQVSWRRTVVEVFGLAIIAGAAFFALQYIRIPVSDGQYASDGWLVILQDLTIVYLATLVGVTFARWAAPWPLIFARLKGSTRGSAGFIAAVVVTTTLLVNVPTVYSAIPYVYSASNAYTVDVIWSVVGSGILLAIVIVGAMREARRLDQLITQA